MNRTTRHQPSAPETAAGELGQTMVEYGILISVISVALLVVVGVTGFGGALGAYYAAIQATIAAAP
jgi:Flp pilus assembly pilin Flp